MFRLLLNLLRHRVTYRFLVVLCAALGYASLTGDLSSLESTVCSLLTCTDEGLPDRMMAHRGIQRYDCITPLHPYRVKS